MPKAKGYPWKRGGQTDRLFLHLCSGRTLTRYEAMLMFRTQNLTARISEIREEVGSSLKVKIKVDPNDQAGIAIPFPQRDLIIFCAFSVILATLLLQGLTLPPLIKWLEVEA